MKTPKTNTLQTKPNNESLTAKGGALKDKLDKTAENTPDAERTYNAKSDCSAEPSGVHTFCLSDTIDEDRQDPAIAVEYVKEFIKRLKEKINSNSNRSFSMNLSYDNGRIDCIKDCIVIIDKLAGEKLNGN